MLGSCYSEADNYAEMQLCQHFKETHSTIDGVIFGELRWQSMTHSYIAIVGYQAAPSFVVEQSKSIVELLTHTECERYI